MNTPENVKLLGLKCPYCGFFVSSACECSHGIDKRWQEVKCEICGETFMASRTISGCLLWCSSG